jgi:hypothetical protein
VRRDLLAPRASLVTPTHHEVRRRCRQSGHESRQVDGFVRLTEQIDITEFPANQSFGILSVKFKRGKPPLERGSEIDQSNLIATVVGD